MAAPTVEFWLVPPATAEADVNTPAKRTALETGSELSTGAGNEADFGTVDISAGAANSAVVTVAWKATANGGNTAIDNGRLWLATAPGWAQAASVVNVQPLSGADEVSVTNTENYTVSAGTGDYTWAEMDEGADPGQNMWKAGPDDTVTALDITTPGTSDDVYFWAFYCAIASGETTGTYTALDSGYELQFSLKFEYS